LIFCFYKDNEIERNHFDKWEGDLTIFEPHKSEDFFRLAILRNATGGG